MSKTELYIAEKNSLSGGLEFLAVNHNNYVFTEGNTKGTALNYQRINKKIQMNKLSDIKREKKFLTARGYKKVTANEFNRHI